MGGHLVEAATDGVGTLNPLFGGKEHTGNAIGQTMFENLLYADAAGEPHPNLAAALPTISDDKLTITFKLRQGIKWSDGRPLTADDVVFTYRVHSAPEYEKTNTGRRGRFNLHVESVSAPDPETVVFKMKDIWPAFTIIEAHQPIVPKHVLETLSAEALNSAPFNQNPTPSMGPFKFVSWEAGERITLARNEAYWGRPAWLDGYVYRPLSNSTAVLNGLESGEVDFGPVAPTFLSQLQSIPTVAVHSFVLSAIDFLYFQMDPAKPASKIFADRSVRQALLLALDRVKMVQGLYFGQAEPGDSPIPKVSWAHTSTGVPTYDYDKARAESLLDAAGWRKGPSGIRQKDGQDLRFEVVIIAGRAPYPDMAANLQSQWQEIGVQAVPRQLESSAVTDQLVNKREFDTLIFPLNASIDPDQFQVWSSAAAEPGLLNASHWTSSEADKLIAEGAGTFDVQERKEAYAKFQQLFMTELPAAPLFFPKAIYGVNKRVNGLIEAFGNGSRWERAAWMKNVWVSGGR